MNEANKTKKIFIIVISCLVFIVTSILTGTTVYYKHQYNKSVECYRQLIDESRRRNEQYAEVYRTARDTNRAVGESLSKCKYSIDELRAALQLVREKYAEMENLLNSVGRSNDFDGGSLNSIDNNVSKEVKETR